jgi:cellulose 1,4-beta-cellobiosidase
VSTGGRLNVNRAIRSCGVAVPAAPTGLNATPGDSQVQLAWSAAGGATSYNVKRSTISGGPYTIIATGVTTTDYLDSGLTNGVTYFYVVSALNAAGESGDSAEASATPGLAVPFPPQNLNATPGDARVSLTWLPSSGAAAYRIKRGLAKAGPYALIAEVAGTSFTDTTVTNGTKYFYVVSAVNAAGESKNSNKASAVPMPVPMPPTGVAATTGVNAGEIALSWNASAWATSYKVTRSTTSGGPYSSAKKVTALNFTQTGLTSGRTYFFVITAVNAVGESGPSAEVSAVAR